MTNDAAPDILTEAHGLVRGDRLKFYGPPHENFQRIANLWTAYLGPTLSEPLNCQDICALMVLLKQARIKTGGGYHRDSAVDTAGYAALQEILYEAEHGASADEWIRGALQEEPTGVHVAVPGDGAVVVSPLQARDDGRIEPVFEDPLSISDDAAEHYDRASERYVAPVWPHGRGVSESWRRKREAEKCPT